MRWAAVAAGLGVLLTVLATVINWHYLQIEWQITAAVPLGWWYAGQVAGLLGGPLLFAALGLGLGRVPDQQPAEGLLNRLTPGPLPSLLWYGGSVAAVLALLWRYGAGYGIEPIRDLPELARFLVLPPSGLSLAYGLAVFPLLARVIRGVPTPAVLGAGVAAAVLAAVAATQAPALGTTAELTRHLLFFLIGWRGGRAADALAALTAPPVTRPLAQLGHAALPIAALLAPVTALSGAVVVKRLSVLGGSAQLVVAVAEPVLLTAAIVTAGLIGQRLLAVRPVPVPR